MDWNGVTIRMFATHPNPHPDELAARMLIEWVADGRFRYMAAPDVVRNARFVVWGGSTASAPESRTTEEWLRRGVLPLGTGGEHIFNDHSASASDGKKPVAYCKLCAREGEQPRFCATDLVALEFDIANDPRLCKLLTYVHANDCHGTSAEFDWSKLVASAQRATALDPEATYRFCRDLLFEPYWKQQEDFQRAGERFNELGGRIVTIDVKRHDSVVQRRMAVIDGLDESDTMFGAWARSAEGGDCDLVLTRNIGGNVVILKKGRSDLRMAATIAVLRWMELRLNPGMAEGLPDTSFETLSRPNTLPGVQKWHGQAETGHIFNGSATHPDVAPTSIPLEDIEKVMVGLTLPRHTQVERDWNRIDVLVRECLR